MKPAVDVVLELAFRAWCPVRHVGARTYGVWFQGQVCKCAQQLLTLDPITLKKYSQFYRLYTFIIL